MRVLDDGPLSPVENMDRDYQQLLNADIPTLRFYQWHKHSATYGYFTKAENFLKEDSGLNLARRPTGGGIIFHDFDLAFSVLIPASHPSYSINTLENYAFVNKKLLSAIQQFNPNLSVQCFCSKGDDKPNFCMARSTIYDLIVEGKKVAGGAMRKTARGFLHQGSICLRLPERSFLEKVLERKLDVDSLLNHSFPLLKTFSQTALLKQCIIESFCTN